MGLFGHEVVGGVSAADVPGDSVCTAGMCQLTCAWVPFYMFTHLFS